ncbi:MAG TPA: 2-phospho-L-lactate transferase CofD family protein, partial [Chlamydiales bacterium]
EAGKILNIKGKVIPITTHQVRLKMLLNNRKVLEGEREIYLSQEIDLGYKTIYLEPYPKINPRVLDEISTADLIVIGPGGLHTSLIPNLLVEGMSEAICQSDAKKVFVVNLMNRKGQTTGYKTSHYLQELVRFLGRDVFDHILFNVQKPPDDLIEFYATEGELVENDISDSRVMPAHLLGPLAQEAKKDIIKRNLIRHDSKKLAQELMKVVSHL